jgi:four helix bundle protein
MRITRFEDIDAWKKARLVTAAVYKTTTSASFSRDSALQRQMRRCAASTMANIAEGFDSGSRAEFSRFVRIARRSATELQSHLYVALDHGYVPEKSFQELYAGANEVKKLIGGFLRYLKSHASST